MCYDMAARNITTITMQPKGPVNAVLLYLSKNRMYAWKDWIMFSLEHVWHSLFA